MWWWVFNGRSSREWDGVHVKINESKSSYHLELMPTMSDVWMGVEYQSEGYEIPKQDLSEVLKTPFCISSRMHPLSLACARLKSETIETTRHL